MKKKLLGIFLIIVLIVSKIPVYIALADNSYDTVSKTVSIDTPWTSSTLEATVTGLHSTLTEITTLNITAGELTDEDVMWISGNLSELKTLNIIESSSFEDNELPDGAFSCLDYYSTKMSKLESVTIDIDDEISLEFRDDAFYKCNALESVSIPEATYFRDYAFEYCTSLKNINLPKVTYFQRHAFAYCDNLITMTLGFIPSTIGDEFKYYSPKGTPSIIVPSSAVDDYKALDDGDTSDDLWYKWDIVSVPSVLSVNVPISVPYNEGDKLDFTVNFDDNVKVDTSGGKPYIPITLETGGTVNAMYQSGDCTKELLFSYTLKASESDSDGIEIDSLINLNGGTLKDSSDNNVDLVLFSTVSSVKIPSDKTYLEKDNLDFIVNFDKNITVTETPFIPIKLETGGTVNAMYESGSGSPNLVFRYTVEADKQDLNGIELHSKINLNSGTIKDSVGNDADLKLNSVGDTSKILISSLNKTVNIDTSWAGKTLETAVKEECPDLTDITTLNITAGELTDEDVIWITKNLSQLKTLSITRNASFEDNYLPEYAFSGDTWSVYKMSKLESITIDIDDKTSLKFGEQAFYQCDLLTSVTLPRATTFGDFAFNGCKSLTKIILPEVTSFGDYTFGGCSSLININLPKATTFGDYTFIGCSSLINISLPKATTFGDYAFISCSSLINIKLPKVTSFAKKAFRYCSNPITMTLGFLHPYTGDEFAWYSPTATPSIIVPSSVVDDYTAADDGDTSDDLWYKWRIISVPSVLSVDVSKSAPYKEGDKLDFTVNFSDTVFVDTSIGIPFIPITLETGGTVNADYKDGSGTEKLTFSYTVESGKCDSDGIEIGSLINANGGTLKDSADNNADLTLFSSVSSVNVPSDKTYLEKDNLNFTVNFDKNITVTGTPSIPIKLETGGTVNAMYQRGSGSPNLVFRYTVESDKQDINGIELGTKITLNGGILKDGFGNDVILTLDGVADTSKIFISSLNKTVKIDIPWTGKTLETAVKEKCPTLTDITILNITAGELTDDDVMWISENLSQLKTLNITGSASFEDTSLPDYAFSSTRNMGIYTKMSKLESITIDTDDKTPLKFGEEAFSSCALLTKVNIPEATSFGNYAFLCCNSLISVTIPEVTTFGDGAFALCYKLTNINLPKTISFGEGAFVRCNEPITMTLGVIPPSTIDSFSRYSSKETPLIIVPSSAVGDYQKVDDGDPSDNLWYGWTISGAHYVLSVNVPSDDTYIKGENLDFTVNFDENITVTGTPFIPITLKTGGTVNAVYESRSGSPNLIFRYTVESNKEDLNGIELGSSINLNGGTLKDATGDNALLTLYNVGDTTEILIDSIKSTYTQSSSSSTTKKEEITVAVTDVKENIEKLKKEGKDTATIEIPDKNDSVSELEIKIPKESLNSLDKGDINLEINTRNVKMKLPKESIESFNEERKNNEELFFKVILIKDNLKQKEIEENIKKSNTAKFTIKNYNNMSTSGTSMEIETNMQSKPVDIILPVTNGLPTDKIERENYLKQLSIFVEHSDGDEEIIIPEIVEYETGVPGLKFTINKFSTFTIIEGTLKEDKRVYTFNMKEITDVNKQWTIKFNNNINEKTIDSKNIKITEEDKPIDITLKIQKKEVIIKSNTPYKIGKVYNLIIEDEILDVYGLELNQKNIMPFKIAN